MKNESRERSFRINMVSRKANIVYALVKQNAGCDGVEPLEREHSVNITF